MFCSACGGSFEGKVCPVCRKSDLDDFGRRKIRRVPIEERARGGKPSNVATTATAATAGISRVAQAQTLFDQAMKERALGNISAAKMSLKLALSYDRENVDLRDALADLTGDETAAKQKK